MCTLFLMKMAWLIGITLYFFHANLINQDDQVKLLVAKFASECIQIVLIKVQNSLLFFVSL